MKFKDYSAIIKFRGLLGVLELIDELKTKRNLSFVDVGGAHGVHANYFREVLGARVDIVDETLGREKLFFEGDFLDFSANESYDVLWTSHTLEHVLNPNLFLSKCASCIKHDGLIAVTVPPIKSMKPTAIQHLSLWDIGTLALQLGYAGFDIETCKIAQYGSSKHGNNITAIARKCKQTDTPDIIAEKMRARPELMLPLMERRGEKAFVSWNNKIYPDFPILKDDSLIDFVEQRKINHFYYLGEKTSKLNENLKYIDVNLNMSIDVV